MIEDGTLKGDGQPLPVHSTLNLTREEFRYAHVHEPGQILPIQRNVTELAPARHVRDATCSLPMAGVEFENHGKRIRFTLQKVEMPSDRCADLGAVALRGIADAMR